MSNGELYALEWDDIDFDNLLLRAFQLKIFQIKAFRRGDLIKTFLEQVLSYMILFLYTWPEKRQWDQH
jgi:hypothetical protein